MRLYIKQLQKWTKENFIDWEYFPAYGNLFGEYIDGDVSLCRLVAGDIYYKLVVNGYATRDSGTVVFYIMSTDPYYPLIESLRRSAMRRAKRIEI